MKKFFIGAAAAIVALASCSKISVVNDDVQHEIGLKAIAGVMTKAPITSFGDATNMGVYADYKAAVDGSDYEPYFSDFEFHKNGTSWAGWEGGAHSPKYYPVSGTLDFFAYSPKNANVTAERTGTDLVFTYTMANNQTNQNDVLVSQIRSGVVKPNAATDVALAFKHALSLIDINVKKTGSAEVLIKSITLNKTNHAGTATVTFASRDDKSYPTIVWEATGSTSSDEIANEQTLTDALENCNTVSDLLVVPTATTDKTMTIVYTIDGGLLLTHTLELENSGKWEPSTKYTYDITVGPLEITVAPSIEVWATPDPAVSELSI